MSNFDLKQALLKNFEATKQLDLSASIEDLSKESVLSNLSDILQAIQDLTTDSERDFYITKLAKKTGISKRAIKGDLKKLVKENVPIIYNDNIKIVHPSYDSQKDFVILGFKETTVVGNRPTDRNIYILAQEDGASTYHEVTIDIKDYKVVIDERERNLVNLKDRWSREGMQGFTKDPVSPVNVYNKVKETLKQYIDLPKEELYGLVAAWIIATYFHRDFNAMPFFFFYGKKQCGKSRALDVLARLCFNSMKVKGVSVPSMADSVDGVRGTFIMDQAEILSEKNNLEMLGIFADSYTPDGGKRRIVHITNKSRKVVEFETYSPKVFASIKEIDTDLKDRCIEIVMVRADKEYPYPEPFHPIWGELRDCLYRLMLTKWSQVREIYKDAGKGMTQRVRELWRPLETILILENVSSEEQKKIRQVFLESMIETQAGLTELEEKLIETILEMIGDRGAAVLTVQDIVDHMDLPESERFKKSTQLRVIGKRINKLSLFTERAGKAGNRKNQYLFNTDHVKNIFNRFGINSCNGVTAETMSRNDIDDAVEDTPCGGNGVEQMAKHDKVEDTSSYAVDGKSNGLPERSDNRECSRYAVEADSSEVNKKNIVSVNTPSVLCSIPSQDDNGLTADDDVFVHEDDIPEIKMPGAVTRPDLEEKWRS